MDALQTSKELEQIQKDFKNILTDANELIFYSNNFYCNSKNNPAKRISELATINITIINIFLNNLKEKGVL
ncbi:MAG: hypothetical protein WAR79_11860 [Melioribacteraceae bacterium]